ncbi:conserved hypothetical protein [Cupriavidus taiwanensis]|uniref:hypothetical protein n=1 Tax=Cupriavidus taiwanensis TaxID=164546 RepID=UPI000E194EF9|nr:hypothetical protein [Cupriavidus taiwanensis]SPA30437.1 conserved hypothetical protein [Cupriavidus taiwanensis]
MKQHLAKSLVMAGAMIASYPLFAQQAQPLQPAQPMPMTQPMQSAQPVQAMPAAPSAPMAQMAPAAPAAGGSYAQAPMPPVQPGMAPAPADASLAGGTMSAVDPASMSLAPDALGSRLGQRSTFLDGA